MKRLFKKLMISALALTMIFQMTGMVFAASTDWEENGKYYSAYVNRSGDQLSQYVIYSGTGKQHTYGTETALLLAPGRSVTSEGTESFPSAYSSKLYTSMRAAGFSPSLTSAVYNKNAVLMLVVSSTSPSQTYFIAQHFVGYVGDWGVLSSKTSDGPRTYVTHGTFSWAPIGYYEIPVIYPEL